MGYDFSDRIKLFQQALTDASTLSCIARDSDLQRAAIKDLSELLTLLKSWKEEVIAEKNEDRANQILGMECLARAASNELNMWLMLKADKPDKAWGNLIAAQTETRHAIQAHKIFAGNQSHAEHLNAIEKIVFPPQVFLSAGLIVGRQLCSICGADYEDCAHIIGIPYWGELCFRRLLDVVADHVSIVDDPANRNCRITHFDDGGGKRNRMTWRIEKITEPTNTQSDEKGRTASAILLTESDLKN
jgi:hypothetical protein